ncbi:MAG: cytochrome c biogenesis protein CcsA [Planctomycetales bacterium]|nr:cytochrome c biogenesis protein CcsA [Planctomycetales bacterium]
MLDGISTTCFAASYTVALGIELGRLFSYATWPRKLKVGCAAAGMVAHTLYIASRATAAGNTSPLSSPYDWYLLSAWTLMAIYFYFEVQYGRAAVALFLLPLVLGLIGAAQFADTEPFAPLRASRGWGNIHGTSLLFGTVSVLIGFVAGLMYLLQSYQLKHKMLPTEGLRLPNLERLGTINSRSIAWSVLFIGIGFGSGVVLNLIKHQQDDAYLPWNDPVVLSFAGMFLWLLIANIFNWAYRPVRLGKKVAYLTVASFLFLVVSMAVLLFGPTEHGARHGGGEAALEATLPNRASHVQRLLPAGDVETPDDASRAILALAIWGNS